MRIDQFEAYFDETLFVYLDRETCRSESRFQTTHTFVGSVYTGEWIRGVTAGGCRKYNTGEYTHFFFSDRLSPQIHSR